MNFLYGHNNFFKALEGMFYIFLEIFDMRIIQWKEEENL